MSPPRVLVLAHDGAIEVGADFTAVEGCWMAGLARMAETGDRLLMVDGSLSGPSAQALAVHEGISYDLEVDTTSETPATAARTIHRHLFACRSDR